MGDTRKLFGIKPPFGKAIIWLVFVLLVGSWGLLIAIPAIAADYYWSKRKQAQSNHSNNVITTAIDNVTETAEAILDVADGKNLEEDKLAHEQISHLLTLLIEVARDVNGLDCLEGSLAHNYLEASERQDTEYVWAANRYLANQLAKSPNKGGFTTTLVTEFLLEPSPEIATATLPAET